MGGRKELHYLHLSRTGGQATYIHLVFIVAPGWIHHNHTDLASHHFCLVLGSGGSSGCRGIELDECTTLAPAGEVALVPCQELHTENLTSEAKEIANVSLGNFPRQTGHVNFSAHRLC